MAGNVNEWVQDWFKALLAEPNSDSVYNDPQYSLSSSVSGTYKLARGGGGVMAQPIQLVTTSTSPREKASRMSLRSSRGVFPVRQADVIHSSVNAWARFSACSIDEQKAMVRL